MGSTSYHNMLLVINSLGVDAQMHTCMQMHAHTHAHACTHAHAHACTTHTRMHTDTQTHQPPGQTNFQKSGVCVSLPEARTCLL